MSLWPEVALGEVLIERRETPDPVEVELGTIPIVAKIRFDSGQLEFREGNGSKTGMILIRPGDLVISGINAYKGAIALYGDDSPGPVAATIHYGAYQANPDRVDARYLWWLLRSCAFRDSLARKVPGGVKTELKAKRLLPIPIPLPPVEEQRRVVRRIEQLAASMGAAARAHEAADRWSGSLLSRSASLVFDAALTRASIPIRDVVVFERGRFTPRPRNDPRFFGGQHPWIQIGEIEAADKYIHGWTRTLNDQGLAVSRKFPAGTVLISIAATIGSVGILGFDCCVPDSVVAAMPTSDVDSEFVYYYLSYLRGHLEELAPQSAQKNINLRILQSLPFPRVPRGEQRRIVDFLDRIRTQCSAIARVQAQRTALVNALT